MESNDQPIEDHPLTALTDDAVREMLNPDLLDDYVQGSRESYYGEQAPIHRKIHEENQARRRAEILFRMSYYDNPRHKSE